VSESISIIDTESLGVSGVVAAYLVSGKETALVDMGHRSSAEVVIRDLTAHGFDRLDYLLPTHVHLDHCGSCGTLARRYPDASILVHPRGEPHLHDPDRLVKGAGEVFGQDMVKRFGLPDPIDNNRLRGIADDESINLGKGLTLRAIWTPGHAPHHLSYLLEGTGSLFTGDAVGVLHPSFPVLVPTTPPPSFNLEDAIESLERLGKLPVNQLFTPHFGVYSNDHWVQSNSSALLEWRTKLNGLKDKGAPMDQIIEEFLNDVSKQIGRSVTEVPEHLRLTTKVSVLGFTAYLKWKSSES
jgi:glyoxylase-like metal-dependent hydrolase (beta-lactamase superfamily II)